MSAQEEARRIRERLSDKEAERLINAPRRSAVEIAKGTGATYLSPAPVKAHEHDVHRITHPITGDLYAICPCGWEVNLSEADPDIDDDWDDDRTDDRSTDERDFNREGQPEFNGAFG